MEIRTILDPFFASLLIILLCSLQGSHSFYLFLAMVKLR